MRHSTFLIVAACVMTGARGAQAATPIYSFESLTNAAGVIDPAGTRPDGFGPNGGGITVTQDTVGATDAAHSAKVSMVGGATFSGALTPLFPAQADDPNVYALVRDVTIPDGGQFSGAGFARLGITGFGANDAQLGTAGGAAQTTAEAEASIAIAPGTYHITIPLISRNNPVTFDINVPFYTIFGTDPDSQMTPTGFQYYINKSNTSPITMYVDNVRVALPGDVDGNGKIDADDYALIDRGARRTFASDSPPGWINGDLNTDGHVNAADYLIIDQAYLAQHGGSAAAGLLAERRGQFGDAYAAALLASVPEPTSLLACGVAIPALLPRRRR